MPIIQLHSYIPEGKLFERIGRKASGLSLLAADMTAGLQNEILQTRFPGMEAGFFCSQNMMLIILMFSKGKNF